MKTDYTKEWCKTAADTECMINVKMNHMRNVAASFLNETKALHLERDLVDFLIRIDARHEMEIEELKLIIKKISVNT